MREHAFPRIVSDLQWAQARERVRKEMKPLENSELLEALTRLWKREGTINSRLINAARDMPTVQAYQNHFGGLDAAYKLIGFRTDRDFSRLKTISRLRLTSQKALCDEISAKIRAIGGTAKYLHSGLMLINGDVTVKLRFSTSKAFPGGPIWTLKLGANMPVDVVILARLGAPDRSVLDYFLLPALSGLRGTLRLRKNDNPAFIAFYQFSTLAAVIECFRRCPIQEEA